jgi:hypothetical protein
MTQQQPRHFASAEVTGQVLTVRHDPGRDAVRTVIGIGDNNRMQVTFWKNAAAASIPQGAVIRAWGRLSQWGQPLRTTLDVSPHTQHGFCLVDPAATKPSAGWTILGTLEDVRGDQATITVVTPARIVDGISYDERRTTYTVRVPEHLAPVLRELAGEDVLLRGTFAFEQHTDGYGRAVTSLVLVATEARHRGQPLLSVTRAEPEPEAPPPPRPRRTNGPARDVSIPF